MSTVRLTAYVRPWRKTWAFGRDRCPRLGREKEATIWRGFICRICGLPHDGDDWWGNRHQKAPLPLDPVGRPQCCADCWRKRLQPMWREAAGMGLHEALKKGIAAEIADGANTAAIARLYINEHARWAARGYRHAAA